MGAVPSPEVLVMGAAIIHLVRVLAARRTTPHRARGLWEVQGVHVEPGEDPDAAIVREIAEELACGIRVVGHLRGEEHIKNGYTLRVAVADLVEGEPVPHEHDAVRWLDAGQLEQVAWLAPDVPFLPELGERLAAAR
jgi:8-oxo-dGTP diphosphatase